uniref:Uncharacterized protein n=1 Tax=Oryza meridionalis TaxID=40149 RepID=A0A0E0EBX3_9ORYZ
MADLNSDTDFNSNSDSAGYKSMRGRLRIHHNSFRRSSHSQQRSRSSMAPRRSSPRSSRPIIHRRTELAVEAQGRVVSKKPSGSGSPINKMSFKKGDEVPSARRWGG